MFYSIYIKAKGHGQSHKIKNFGMMRKALSQEMYTRNLPLMVQKLWQLLKFSDIYMYVKGHGHR